MERHDLLDTLEHANRYAGQRVFVARLRPARRFHYASSVETRFHQAAAVVGPTDSVVPATSGVTLYGVKNEVIDDGEFIPIRSGALRP